VAWRVLGHRSGYRAGHRLGVIDCVILGAITGIGGMLRDILVREVSTVVRGGSMRSRP
jgi:uncharacterized membrane protein YeiH